MTKSFRRKELRKRMSRKQNKTNEHELKRRRALQRMIICICRLNIWEHQKRNKKCYPNTMIGVNHDTSRYVAKVSKP
jgi:hypothetical protein